MEREDEEGAEERRGKEKVVHHTVNEHLATEGVKGEKEEMGGFRTRSSSRCRCQSR